MRTTMQSKIIKHAIDKRIDAGYDVVTINDIIGDINDSRFTNDIIVKTFRLYAKSVNYTFNNDRIVRSQKFQSVQ